MKRQLLGIGLQQVSNSQFVRKCDIIANEKRLSMENVKAYFLLVFFCTKLVKKCMNRWIEKCYSVGHSVMWSRGFVASNLIGILTVMRGSVHRVLAVIAVNDSIWFDAGGKIAAKCYGIEEHVPLHHPHRTNIP